METQETLRASEIRSAEGRYPSQIVLRQVKEKTYATHLKVMPPDAEPYFILGSYFFSLEGSPGGFRAQKGRTGRIGALT